MWPAYGLTIMKPILRSGRFSRNPLLRSSVGQPCASFALNTACVADLNKMHTTHGDKDGIDASGFPGPRRLLTTSGAGNQATRPGLRNLEETANMLKLKQTGVSADIADGDWVDDIKPWPQLQRTCHQTYNKEPERRLGETCITRTACELGDAHSDCIHWQCQCKKGFRIEFLHGVPVCVTGFFPNQCYSHNQCIEMDEHALCVSNVCDCENGYQRELIYWKYVCRPEKSDKSLIIFILSFTLLLLIVVLLYIGKHYVQSECAGPPNPPCPASTTITGFTGSIQDADSPEWDLVVIPRAVRPPSPVLPSKEDLPPSYEEVMRYLSQQSSKR
ncbi:uncharacterized protein [Dermacentor albipictus]|uniref:uncharacterized protein isoform X2 n=1 Tax=Dermacentor albipictus TaxID=60249 RepID=UPI0038FD0ACB